MVGLERTFGKNLIFSLIFFNTDISITNEIIVTKFKPHVNIICIEGQISQNFDTCPRFYFMTKKRKSLLIFLNFIFLHFIKQKL